MKDHKDDKTLDIVDAEIIEENGSEIEDADMDELEAALDNRVAWSDAVQLVNEALEEWVQYNSDLIVGAADEKEAESIHRLSEETLKAWQRILQG